MIPLPRPTRDLESLPLPRRNPKAPLRKLSCTFRNLGIILLTSSILLLLHTSLSHLRLSSQLLLPNPNSIPGATLFDFPSFPKIPLPKGRIPTHNLTSFVYPPNVSYASTYLLFTPEKPRWADTRVRRMEAHERVPEGCLEEWVARGRWEGGCLEVSSSRTVEEGRVDFVWMWVNGSDPLHITSRRIYTGSDPLPIYKQLEHAKHFREHGELQFSMRSVVNATSAWGEDGRRRRLHLVVNSFGIDGDSGTEPDADADAGSANRIAQIPQWLDLEKLVPAPGAAVDPGLEVVLHTDASIFRPLPYTTTNTTNADSNYAIRTWREAALPTFNSMAVESQLSNLPPSEVSDNTVFLMDDTFILLPPTPSTFHSPLHGPIFHMQSDLLVQPLNKGKTLPADGEWRGLGVAASRLSTRFGTRPRPYLIHNARSIPLSLLHEASLAFPEAFSGSAKARFRGQEPAPAVRAPSVQDGDGVGVHGEEETHTLWLATHFIVERHREALLWSWIVAKWGGPSGIITFEDKKAMWAELGGSGIGGEEETIEVAWPKRTSRLNVPRDLEKAGADPMGVTDYSFLSSDGYPYVYLPMRNFLPRAPERNGWPDFAAAVAEGKEKVEVERPRVCTIKWGEMFDERSEPREKEEERAVELLKWVMVDRPSVGDCIISALVGRTGPVGFEIFLPPPSPSSSPSSSSPSTPPTPIHLPLSLPSLLTHPYPRSARTYALRLLQRYTYTLGSTPSRFFGFGSPIDAEQRLMLTDRDKSVVMVCVNDDMKSVTERTVWQLDYVMRRWMGGRWRVPMPVEVGVGG